MNNKLSRVSPFRHDFNNLNCFVSHLLKILYMTLDSACLWEAVFWRDDNSLVSMWTSEFVHHVDALLLVFKATNISLAVLFGQANKYFRFSYVFTSLQVCTRSKGLHLINYLCSHFSAVTQIFLVTSLSRNNIYLYIQ